MVPAVAREMHKLGFDQDIKERTDFPTFKIFLDRFYIEARYSWLAGLGAAWPRDTAGQQGTWHREGRKDGGPAGLGWLSIHQQ